MSFELQMKNGVEVVLFSSNWSRSGFIFLQIGVEVFLKFLESSLK